MSDWVSVAEKLPEESGFYLVWLPDKSPFDLNFAVAFFIERKGIFVTPDGGDGLKPKYWMAVYEPPKLAIERLTKR